MWRRNYSASKVSIGFPSGHYEEGASESGGHQLSFRKQRRFDRCHFEREFVPVNEARLAALDAVQRSGKKNPKLEDILEAFIRPTVQCSIGNRKAGKLFQSVWALPFRTEPGNRKPC